MFFASCPNCWENPCKRTLASLDPNTVQDLGQKEKTTITINITCCACGRGKPVELEQPIEYAFELANIAHEIGMLGTTDTENSRVLVFCDAKCRDAQKKKNGGYRKNIIRLDRDDEALGD